MASYKHLTLCLSNKVPCSLSRDSREPLLHLSDQESMLQKDFEKSCCISPASLLHLSCSERCRRRNQKRAAPSIWLIFPNLSASLCCRETCFAARRRDAADTRCFSALVSIQMPMQRCFCLFLCLFISQCSKASPSAARHLSVQQGISQCSKASLSAARYLSVQQGISQCS